MNRIFRLTFAALAAALLFSCQENPYHNTIDSISSIGENIWYMEFKGDDGIDTLMERGGASGVPDMQDFGVEFYMKKLGVDAEFQLQQPGMACSELCTVTPEGDHIIGRNFDWYRCDIMVVRTEPENGYKSLATSNMNFLGIPSETTLTEEKDRFMCISCLMAPMDGINEKGLTIAINDAGDGEGPQQDTDKPDLTFSIAVRLILDKAATVDEALAILEAHDMHAETAKPDEALAFHMIIADKSGRSVTVEWVKDAMYVTETDIMTNHYLCEPKRGVTKYGTGEGNSFERYDRLAAIDSTSNGIIEEKVLTDAMGEISPSPSEYFGGTQWTAVYNMDRLSATWYWRRDFDHPFKLSL